MSANITIVLTGGSTNADPNASLGGDPSDQMLKAGMNNLFSNIRHEDLPFGQIDYRCVYVFNDYNQALYKVRAYANKTIEGTSVFLGTNFSNDSQRILLDAIPIGGHFTVKYNGVVNTVELALDDTVFADNLKNALLTDTGIQSVSVTLMRTLSNIVFLIDFTNEDANKFHDLIEITSSTLTDLDGHAIIPEPSRITDGGPINTIPPMIYTPFEEPDGVKFGKYVDTNPLYIGVLNPGEGFPIWVKRVCEAHTDDVPNDGFLLDVKGTPIP